MGVGEGMRCTRITYSDGQDAHLRCVKLNIRSTLFGASPLTVSLSHSKEVSLFHPSVRYLWVLYLTFLS